MLVLEKVRRFLVREPVEPAATVGGFGETDAGNAGSRHLEL
jgi:hypothetical protein